MFVMGGHIADGQVLVDWPTLEENRLNQGDLEITVDYRDILAEIAQNRLGNDDLATLFPNFTPTFRGITN